MTSSALSSRYAFLCEKMQKKPSAGGAPLRSASGGMSADASKKADIDRLKNFYLNRMKQSAGATREATSSDRMKQGETSANSSYGNPFGYQSSYGINKAVSAPRSSTLGMASTLRTNHAGQNHVVAHGSAQNHAIYREDRAEDVDVICNNCFTILKAINAKDHITSLSCMRSSEKYTTHHELLDAKLKKILEVAQERLDDTTEICESRALTNLIYHINCAIKWYPGCAELGGLSGHTVQQIMHLATSAKHLSVSILALCKRVVQVVTQKEKELFLLQGAKSAGTMLGGGGGYPGASMGGGYLKDDDICGGLEVKSIVSELDSDCGTQYSDTNITYDTNAMQNDVGDILGVNDIMKIQDEDEQRKWFYSHCLSLKLKCSDKNRARKVLISDLYTQIKEENVPTSEWPNWILEHLQLPMSGSSPVTSSSSSAEAGPPSLFHSFTPTSTRATTPGGMGSSLHASTMPGRSPMWEFQNSGRPTSACLVDSLRRPISQNSRMDAQPQSGGSSGFPTHNTGPRFFLKETPYVRRPFQGTTAHTSPYGQSYSEFSTSGSDRPSTEAGGEHQKQMGTTPTPTLTSTPTTSQYGGYAPPHNGQYQSFQYQSSNTHSHSPTARAAGQGLNVNDESDLNVQMMQRVLVGKASAPGGNTSVGIPPARQYNI